jgi:hypothetical protein
MLPRVTTFAGGERFVWERRYPGKSALFQIGTARRYSLSQKGGTAHQLKNINANRAVSRCRVNFDVIQLRCPAS